MSVKKIVIATVVITVLGTAAVLSVRQGQNRGIEVTLEEIRRHDLVETVTASGNIRAGRVVDISSDISARVFELLVKAGDDVVKGQVLLRLDPTRFDAQVSRVRAELSQTRANVAQQTATTEQAERDYLRLQRLSDRDSLLVRRQDLETAETAFRVAEQQLDATRFGVAQAEASLTEAEEQLSKTVFLAPIGGKITRLNVEAGETVIVGTMNNAGSLVLTISELSEVEAVIQVDETDIPYLNLGDSAILELDAFPNQFFSGRVTEIGNSAIVPPSQSAGTGQTAAVDFEVVIAMDSPPGGIRPDLSVTADVVIDVRQAVLGIPIIGLTVRGEDEGALPEDDDDAPRRELGPSARRPGDSDVEGAFVVRDGKVSFVAVEIGITGQDYFEVLSGLEEGDTVVAGPYQRIRDLRDGDEVRNRDQNSGSR